MSSRAFFAILSVAALAGCHSQTTPPTPPATPADGNQQSTPTAPTAPGADSASNTPAPAPTPPPVLPDSLKNTAFDYYGLAQTAPQKNDLKVNGSKFDGSRILQLQSVNGDTATYQETQTGAAEGDQNQTDSLSADGIYVEATSPETLKTPHVLELPNKLDVGSTWKSHFAFEANGKDLTIDRTCKVIGPRTLKLKGGNMETLYVEGQGTGTYDGSPVTTKEQWWYAKGKGPVKSLETISMGGKVQTVETDAKG